jgi:hypothetical protein
MYVHPQTTPELCPGSRVQLFLKVEENSLALKNRTISTSYVVGFDSPGLITALGSSM